MFYVYLIQSLKKLTEVYVGSTNDLRRRIGEHNGGTSSSTKRYAPWRLIAYEAYRSEDDARERENKLKLHGNAIKELRKRSRRSFKNGAPEGLPSTILENKNGAGFTLIEMTVSVAVFSIVMLVATGALLSIVGANRKAQAQQTAINNLNFAVENMTRGIRTGTLYHCGSSGALSTPQDCPSGSSVFAFEAYGGNPAASGDQVVYRLQNGRLEVSTDGAASFTGVTAPEVFIENLSFYLVGSPIGDGYQPKLLVEIGGSVELSAQAKADFNLQTVVSQRLFDI